MRELGPRDSVELNADLFMLSLSPYNDGLNSFDFFLYASGVQADVKNFSTRSDISSGWAHVIRSMTTFSWNCRLCYSRNFNDIGYVSDSLEYNDLIIIFYLDYQYFRKLK
jgi:hypothetical protein